MKVSHGTEPNFRIARGLPRLCTHELRARGGEQEKVEKEKGGKESCKRQCYRQERACVGVCVYAGSRSMARQSRELPDACR